MGKYIKKKLSIVEAFQFKEDHEEEYPEWFKEAIRNDVIRFCKGFENETVVHIKINDSKHIFARNGDYIIRQQDGSITRCASSIFESIYTETNDLIGEKLKNLDDIRLSMLKWFRTDDGIVRRDFQLDESTGNWYIFNRNMDDIGFEFHIATIDGVKIDIYYANSNDVITDVEMKD